MPRGAELAARLSSVLEVLYLIFNEGYAATAGDDWLRPGLCEEALRLGRILAELVAEEPEVHGLVALMEIQASAPQRARRPRAESRSFCSTRTARAGTSSSSAAASPPSSAPSARRRAAAPTRCRPRSPPATPARAPPRRPTGRASSRSTTRSRSSRPPRSWSSIAPSPSRWPSDPPPALEIVDALADEPSLQTYHLLPTVRGDFLAKLGRPDEARAEFERAASLTRNARERDFLLGRAAAARDER